MTPPIPIKIIPQPMTEELREEGKKKLNREERQTKKGYANQTPTKVSFNSAEKCKTFDIKCQRAR